MSRRASWIAIAVAAGFVALVLVFSASNWAGIDDSGISATGWGVMVVGVVITLALGIGLMALVFISSRRGYDETDGHDR